MRVLQLLKTSEGATWALRQMRELVRLGVDVHVALPSGGKHFDTYQALGITTHDVMIDFSAKEMHRRIDNMKRVVSDVKPDLIHSHFVGTTLTMRLALKGPQERFIPRIFQVPGPLHLEHALFRNIEILSAKTNDFWIGSCEKTLEYYRNAGISENRLFLSYYGTDTDEFVRRSSWTLRKLTGIASQTQIIGIVAYMYAPKKYLGQQRGLKGHEDLIDAVKIGLTQGYDVALVVIGGAWNGATDYEQSVRDYAVQRLGERAYFLGIQKDVTALYPGFDVAVHPSHSENVGGAVESLLLGVPTVTTNIGGFPDVVREGETGWTTTPRNPFSLWAAIARMLDDPIRAQALTRNGEQLVRHLFDVRRTAAEIADIYRTILAR